MDRNTPAYTLYGYWRSSSSWRVRLALEHKQIPCEHVAVHLVRDGGEQHQDAYAALNPMRQVPLLIAKEGGARFAQSVAIVEYLEEAHPSPALLPDDLAARAHVRELVELINAGTQPLQNLAVLQYIRGEMEQDARPFGAHWIEKGLRAYEARCAEWSGRFSFGDSVTLADIFLIPQLYNARRFGVELEQFSELLRIEAVCAALPAFQRAHPDAQPDRPENPTP